MTLMDAQQYDEARDRRRRKVIIVAVLAGLLLAWVGYHVRNYPERRAADKFFSALKLQNLEAAYSIWQQDPASKEHPYKYPTYCYVDFSQYLYPSNTCCTNHVYL